jgi:hypothetical protein
MDTMKESDSLAMDVQKRPGFTKGKLVRFLKISASGRDLTLIGRKNGEKVENARGTLGHWGIRGGGLAGEGRRRVGRDLRRRRTRRDGNRADRRVRNSERRERGLEA